MIYGYIIWLLINHNNIPGAIKSYKQPYDMNIHIPSGKRLQFAIEAMAQSK